MLLKFDKQKVEIHAACGIEESYKPNKDIKQINAKVKRLKKKVDKFMQEVYDPAAEEIEGLVKEENQKYIVKQ
jgi:predicted transcriptional regulator